MVFYTIYTQECFTYERSSVSWWSQTLVSPWETHDHPQTFPCPRCTAKHEASMDYYAGLECQGCKVTIFVCLVSRLGISTWFYSVQECWSLCCHIYSGMGCRIHHAWSVIKSHFPEIKLITPTYPSKLSYAPSEVVPTTRLNLRIRNSLNPSYNSCQERTRYFPVALLCPLFATCSGY